MMSQFVDSATVNFVFLYANPTVFSGTLGDLWGIVLTVYAVKVPIAAADTPLCYLAVRGIERWAGIDARDAR